MSKASRREAGEERGSRNAPPGGERASENGQVTIALRRLLRIVCGERVHGNRWRHSRAIFSQSADVAVEPVFCLYPIMLRSSALLQM